MIEYTCDHCKLTIASTFPPEQINLTIIGVTVWGSPPKHTLNLCQICLSKYREDPKKFLEEILNSSKEPLHFDAVELTLLRQWFERIALKKDWLLTPSDIELYKKIQNHLQNPIPPEINLNNTESN